MITFIQQKNEVKWLLYFFFFSTLIFLGYFPSQQEFYLIFPIYCIAFLAYLFISQNPYLHLHEVLKLGILIRIILLFSVPAFSDDIYRYLWDGLLSFEGINPYGHTPEQILKKNPDFIGRELFPLLNSPNYFTVYPFLTQLLFLFTGFVSSLGIYIQILAMKSLIIAAEIGSVILLPKLLQALKINPVHACWYILNPLIILELNANAHLESIMIFCLIAAFYLYASEKVLPGFLFYLGAITSKIIPLILVPIIFIQIKKTLRIQFLLLIGLASLLLFIPPILSSNALGILFSFSLYVEYFEFNASIYFLVRYIGALLYGYNTIQIIGPLLMVVSAFIIFYIGLRPQTNNIRLLANRVVMLFTVYLLFSTTIHPWYLSILILGSCFSDFKFPLLWSFLIYLSYYHYTGEKYFDSMWLVATEYLILFGYMTYEFRLYKTKKS